MAENLNITGNIVEFVDVIGQYWTRKRGLFFTFVFEALIFLLLWDKFGFKSILAGLLTALSIATITFIIWLFTSKRILLRSSGLVFLWLVLAIVATCGFYWFLYPQWIKFSKLDYSYVQIWGCLIVFISIVILGLIVDLWIIKGKKLLIVFAVNNESIAVEKTIRSSIDPVVQSIQDSDPRVRLVVLPFGNLKSIRSCVKYIKFPLTRADAIIFASVVDDSDSVPAGYVFTSFSSRVNEKRFVEGERKDAIHHAVLDAHSRCKDWNFLNAANDNCARKIAISKNLEDMLRMYIGCIYLMKHDFKSALPYTNNAVYNESKNSPSYAIASSLYSYSMLSAARELENEDHDYDAALEQLTKLSSTLPVNNNDPGYNKAMARVMYYKGNLKESEGYTKKFKDLTDHRWGYELNMGFYAINKKKVQEFAYHYRNLRKYYPCEQTEPGFAIRFLEYQLKTTQDEEYGTLLQVAIAYLNLYISPKKAKRLMKRVAYNSQNAKSVKAIEDIREIIYTTTKRRETAPRKK